jgi:hypothetical protein
MIDERKQHLELVATGLTRAYYSVSQKWHSRSSRNIETYLFLLDASTNTIAAAGRDSADIGQSVRRRSALTLRKAWVSG